MKTPRIKIDLDRYEVFVGSREVVLSRTEFDIIAYLKKTNKTESRESLRAHVWGVDDHVEPRAIDQHIARLRRKIGVPVINTVPLRGYKFAA